MAGSQLVSYPRPSTSYANCMAEQLNTSSNSAFAVVPPNDDPQSTEPVSIDKIIGDELFQESSDKMFTDLQAEFEVTNHGPKDEYLGVKVERCKDMTLMLSQRLLIQQILDEMGFIYHTIRRAMPALSSQIFSRDCEGEPLRTTGVFLVNSTT